MNGKPGEDSRDVYFMSAALVMAQKAAEAGEVPVGCVIVRGDDIIAAAHNRREQTQNALAHAEQLAIALACQVTGFWRLPDCRLYVTLEPCPMCAGAIINSRIARVVWGAPDPKAGAAGSITDLFAMPFNHRPEVTSGVMMEESADMLRRFFKGLRDK